MKIFNSIKNCFIVLGFDSPQSTRQDLLKTKTILSMLLIGIDVILSSLFVYYEASDFEEYADSIYQLSSLILTFFVSATLLWQMPTHYKFITALEKTIEKSKKFII